MMRTTPTSTIPNIQMKSWIVEILMMGHQHRNGHRPRKMTILGSSNLKRPWQISNQMTSHATTILLCSNSHQAKSAIKNLLDEATFKLGLRLVLYNKMNGLTQMHMQKSIHIDYKQLSHSPRFDQDR